MASRAIPPAGPDRPISIPHVVEAVLPNGLRVLAARRGGVPRVEVRLVLPAGVVHDAPRGGAAAWLAADMLATGIPGADALEIANELLALGGEIETRAGADHVWISGGVLVSGLPRYLELLAAVVSEPTMPASEIEIARERLADRLAESRADAGFAAAERAASLLFGEHPYARVAPAEKAVRGLTRAAVLRFWREHAAPRGSTLVLAGDVAPGRALDAAARAFGSWRAPRRPAGPPPPRPPSPGPGVLVHRRGSVQAAIRLAGFAPRRVDVGYFAALVANTVLGGYFSSRLVESLRERKGYTYSPGSGFVERGGANVVAVSADVRNEVAAAALVEMRYEMDRLCTLPVERAELEAARRWLVGMQAVAIQSQAGLAESLIAAEALGAGHEYLRRYREGVRSVRAEDVRQAAGRCLSRAATHLVIVGDARAVGRDVGRVEPVVVER